MQRIMLNAKIHYAVITQTELEYEGSITIDGVLLDRVGIVENERVQVVNMNNGVRLETYVIRGEDGSGGICLNGPAARLGMVGDKVHILSYVALDKHEVSSHHPTILILNEKNQIITVK